MNARGAAVRGLLWAAVLLVGTVRVAWAQAPPEAIEYYARDAVGSVRIVFDAQGNVLGRSDYLPFGETWNQSGALPRQRFTGQARDGEAGLDDFNARAYQPLFGRFTRPDPVSGSLFAPQSWNAYAYVQNRPLNFGDPSGRSAEAYFRPSIQGFCSAENSFGSCGGWDAFWGPTGTGDSGAGGGGGGGGASFGDGYAWLLSIGWSPGMPTDIASGLVSWAQRSESALNVAVLQNKIREQIATVSSEVLLATTPDSFVNIDGASESKMKAVAFGELSLATEAQYAAVLSTMVNRAFWTGAPISAVLNAHDYQALRPLENSKVTGNIPYQSYVNGNHPQALESAFAYIIQNGVTTNALFFKTTAGPSGLGSVVPASPPSIASGGLTVYLWYPAAGSTVVTNGWSPLGRK